MTQKILVVDDEPRNQLIMEEVLEDQAKEGVQVKIASSAEEALKLIPDYQPDLILLDVMMPGMNGYELCKIIRKESSLEHVKIVLVTGRVTLQERLQGYSVGADDYIVKPFEPEELQAKVRVYLRLIFAEKQLAEFNRSLEEKVKEKTREVMDMQAKLVNSAKMAALGEMAGAIAHEINTPLGAIGLAGEQIQAFVKEDPVDVSTIIQMAEMITQVVERLSEIVRGLKTFSRDGSQDSFVAVPLKKLVDDALALCQEKLKINNIQIKVDPIPDQLTIQCRPVQITQVLLNLINNSGDAIAPLKDKWIQISVQQTKGVTEISVTDSGSGIQENIRDRIFEPFFTTKDLGKGTGLGLSVSKGIIEAHNGEILLNPASNHTQFILRFPDGLLAQPRSVNFLSEMGAVT